MTDSYQNYSLEQIREWVRDAMESESTPEEIYECFVDTVKQNMRYHKACYNTSVKLLSLLRGNKNGVEVVEDWRKVEDTDYNIAPGIKTSSVDGVTTEWSDYWNGNLYGQEFQAALEKYGYEYTPPTDEEINRFKLDSPFLHNDVNLDE